MSKKRVLNGYEKKYKKCQALLTKSARPCLEGNVPTDLFKINFPTTYPDWRPGRPAGASPMMDEVRTFREGSYLELVQKSTKEMSKKRVLNGYEKKRKIGFRRATIRSLKLDLAERQ